MAERAFSDREPQPAKEAGRSRDERGRAFEPGRLLESPGRSAGVPHPLASRDSGSAARLIAQLQRTGGNASVHALLHRLPGRSARTPVPVVSREAIDLRSSHRVTDVGPAAGDNTREEVLDLLDRLHTLWSITNADFDNQYRYVSGLAAGAQVPQVDAAATPAWTFRPTIDAIRRTREPTLAAAVIGHHMGGLSVTDGVGRGLGNDKDDVLKIQDRLNFLAPYPSYAAERAAVSGAAPGAIPDALLSGTFDAISAFKVGIASGRAGWQAVRAAESEHGGDRFAGQTASQTVTVLANHTARDGPAFETQESINVSIFLPSALSSEDNNVFLFFSPGGGTEDVPAQAGANATNVHAIRSGADSTEWIVIGIPGFRTDAAERGWNSIDTAAIQACLTRAGRGANITKLRLAAHSRGGRGLTQTVGHRLIDVGLVDRVIMLDQPHAALAGSLAAALPRGRRAPTIVDYTQAVGVRGAGKALNAQGIRAIGFARLIQDRPDVPPPSGAATLLTGILADLPPRGGFTTDPVAPGSGRTNIHAWIRSHPAAIAAIDAADRQAEAEWRRFFRHPTTALDHAKVDASPYFHVNTQNLMRFFPQPLIDPATGGLAINPATGAPDFGFTLGIYAHHLFVAEISNELFS